MKTKRNYLNKITKTIQRMRFEVGKNPISNCISSKTKLNTRPTMLKITFQPNKQSLSTRLVTSSTLHTLTTHNKNQLDAHDSNLSNQKQQSIEENSFNKRMSNDNDSDECIFIKEETDEVIFVSESNCDIQVSQNERDCVKENAKHFGINTGKILKKHFTPYRRFSRSLKKIISEKIQQSTEINRFDPTTTADMPAPFPINDIKLNLLALLNPSIAIDNGPMTNEAEEKLFAERPELFEKRMVIIDGSNVARKFSWPKAAFSVKGIEICLEHFESRGFNTKVVLPQWRMRRSMSTDPATLDKLHRADKIWLSPAKNIPGNRSCPYDDRFILEIAEKFDAAVVSCDSYGDLLNENPRWDEIIKNRVLNFMCCGGQIIFSKDPYGRFGKKMDIILHKRKTAKDETEDTIPNE